MQLTEVDGVPVFHQPGARRPTMELVFGVGIRDETFATREVTHLVEHLVMGSLPKSALQSNGTTTVDSTHFYATGRMPAVQAFIEGVCAGVTQLAMHRVDAEIGVLQAEDCSGGGGLVESMFAQRYGMTGPGLAFPAGPGPEYLSDEAIADHARRWFVRGNAALVCHGDLPEGLRLDLPEGRAPERAPAVRRDQQGPSWSKSWTAGVGLSVSADGPWSAALRMGIDVLQGRVQDVARTERGLSYSSGIVSQAVDRDRRELVLCVDAREGQEGAVARVVWEQWLALCEAGPTPAELAHVLDETREEIEGADEEDLVIGDLAAAARSHVLDLDHIGNAQLEQAFEAVTAAGVQDAVRAVGSSVLLQVPEWSDFDGLPGLQRRHLCGVVPEPVPGKVVKPGIASRLFGGARGLSLVLGDHALGKRDPDGDLHAIRWEEVVDVVVLADNAGLAVVGEQICMIVVEEQVFGQRTVDRVSALLSRKVEPALWSRERSSLTSAVPAPAVAWP